MTKTLLPRHRRTPTARSLTVTVAARGDAGRTSHPEDAEGNLRLARELAHNAGRLALSRHRARITGMENAEDGGVEDEDRLEETARAERDLDADGLHRNRPVP